MARKRMSYDSQLSLDMFSEVVEVIANPERQVAIELAKETFLVTPVAAAVAAVVEKHVPFVITDQHIWLKTRKDSKQFEGATSCGQDSFRRIAPGSAQ